MPKTRHSIDAVRPGRLMAVKTNIQVALSEELLSGETRYLVVHFEELLPLIDALTAISESCTLVELDPPKGYDNAKT